TVTALRSTQLWPVLCDDQCEDRTLSCFAMDCQFESIGQQCLEHLEKLVIPGPILGLRGDLVLIGIDPVGTAFDQIVLHSVRGHYAELQSAVVNPKRPTVCAHVGS